MHDQELARRLVDVLVGREILPADGTYPEDLPALLDEVSPKQGATPEQLLHVLEEITGCPALDPTALALAQEYVEHLYPIFSPSLARRLTALPFRLEADALYVVLPNPTDATVLADLSSHCGCRIRPYAALPGTLARALDTLYDGTADPPAFEGDALVRAAERATNREIDGLLRGDAGALARVLRDVAVIRLVHTMLVQLIERGTSDIHIESQASGLRVRVRQDGAMRVHAEWPAILRYSVVPRLKSLAGMPLSEQAEPLDGRIDADLVPGRELDMRVSVVPSLFGETMVLRVLDRSVSEVSLEALGLDADALAALERGLRGGAGMVLVTGPTGSGKSTTLAASLSAINDVTTSIITAEDPVEYRIPGAVQVACDSERGRTFASCLRAFLRQDPDVIMVGEIRDAETADIAVKAALTGHLVLSTLHTNDAAATIARLLNLGVDPFLVASSVKTIVAQRLVRRVCEACAGREPVGEEDLRLLNVAANALPFKKVPVPQGCDACEGTGFRGRVGLFEALEVGPELERLILDEAPASALRAVAMQGGMQTLRAAGLRAIAQGHTTVREVVRATPSEAALQ